MPKLAVSFLPSEIEPFGRSKSDFFKTRAFERKNEIRERFACWMRRKNWRVVSRLLERNRVVRIGEIAWR